MGEGIGEGEGGVITGRREVLQAWREAVLGLGPVHRRLVLVDASFADYPLDDGEVIAALTAWLKLPGRTVRMMGCDFEATARAHPRFARWRRDWVHRIEALAPAEPPQQPWPSLLLRDDGGLERLDAVHWRARKVTDVVPWTAWIDASAQRCEPAWPLYSLGL